jgi:hypothetical protein
MVTDRHAGTVTFKLREPGFLKTYEVGEHEGRG